MRQAPTPFREIVIEPTRGSRFVAWRHIFAYRDLLWLLVCRDFVTRYKQTILGPLWHNFQPLLTTVVVVRGAGHVRYPSAWVSLPPSP